jgi:RNA polymerase primary sigma factor
MGVFELDLIREFFADVERFPLPSDDEQTKLAQRARNGDLEAVNEMLTRNLRLAIHWASRYQGRGVEYPDLIQEAILGLRRAVEKFDWEKGYKFSTYATGWIRQSLQRVIHNQGKTIRIPLQVGLDYQAMDIAYNQLQAELKRPPTPEELSEACGFTIANCKKLLNLPAVTASLEQTGQDNATPLSNLVAGQSEASFERVERAMTDRLVAEAIELLDPEESQIIKLSFGFKSNELTVEEISKLTGKKKSEIEKVKKRAMLKLRNQSVLSELVEAL